MFHDLHKVFLTSVQSKKFKTFFYVNFWIKLLYKQLTCNNDI